MVGKSNETFSIMIPCFAASFFAKTKWSLEVSKRLARDAADVETGAAQFLVFFDNGGFESELSRHEWRRHIRRGPNR